GARQEKGYEEDWPFHRATSATLDDIPSSQEPRSPRPTSTSRAARPRHLEQDQVVEEDQQILLLRKLKGHESVTGGGSFAAVLEDRLGEGRGTAVVHVGSGRADAPEVAGEEDRGSRAHFVDRLGQAGPHVVPLEVAEEEDHRLAGGVLAEGAEAEDD